ATFHKKKFMHHRCCMVFTSGTTEDTEERRGVNHKGHEGTGKGAGLIFRFWQFRRLWQFWQFLQPRQSAVRPLPPSAYSVSSAFQRCWVLHNYNLSRELDYVLAATLAATPIRPRPRRGRRSTARESQTIHARRSSVVPRLIAGMDGTKAPAVACHAFGDKDCSRLAGC